jgi:bifunctional DNA-binding transcriptional regulator/antitoxin component of YhaV-PrlF toxin-antitoxin module
MNKLQAQVDKNGQLSFPEEFNLRYGLEPGARVYVDETAKGPRLRLPVTHLKKVYIEPTNRCNLDCRTCMRHAWDEALGQMSRETFSCIIEGLRFSPPPAIFFEDWANRLPTRKSFTWWFRQRLSALLWS